TRMSVQYRTIAAEATPAGVPERARWMLCPTSLEIKIDPGGFRSEKSAPHATHDLPVDLLVLVGHLEGRRADDQDVRGRSHGHRHVHARDFCVLAHDAHFPRPE